MPQPKIETRLHHEASLIAGAAVSLTRDEAHFLRSVLRLRIGAGLALFNARDGEWLAEITALAKTAATVEIVAQRRRPAAEPDLWLVCAPIKKARFDFLVEKATELGVSRILPVMTAHGAVGRVKRERLAAQVREAAEQCERLSLPEVEEMVGLDRLMADWPAERRLLVCAERGPAEPLGQLLRRAAEAREPTGSPGLWAVMTGPEGGYAQSELDALSNLPFVTFVGLGPRVLRADTAALVALALWQGLIGDYLGRPSGRGRELDPAAGQSANRSP